MTDISSITSLITAFRNETREEAITPEVLGALLQKIADIMGKAALQTDINLLNKWRTNVVNIGEILSEIRVGKDDRNNVYFSLEKVEMANANIINLPNQLVIRQATTERAGAMRAQQVIDLNKCKADIAACISSIKQVEEAVTNVKNENKTLNTRISNSVKVLVDHSNSISNLQKDIKAVLAKIKTLQTDIQNVDALKQTTQMHIECIIKDKKLVIQNAYRYVLKGLTPVIFRHSVRTSRKKKNKNGVREKLPRRRGWNRFYDDDKITVRSDDVIQFRCEERNEMDENEYFITPDMLFSKYHTVMDRDDNTLQRVMLPFGARAYNILGVDRSFRFAVGFYKKGEKDNFNFNSLKTNLAEFRVVVKAIYMSDNTIDVKYFLGM